MKEQLKYAGTMMIFVILNFCACTTEIHENPEWKADIASIEKLSVSRDGHLFLFGNTTVPIRFYGEAVTQASQDSRWMIRIRNYRGQNLYKEMFQLNLYQEDNQYCGYKLLKIPSKQEARKVSIEAVMLDEKNDGSADDSLEAPWQTVFSGFTIQDAGELRFTAGWFPPEKTDTDDLLWWSHGQGILNYSQTIVPMICACDMFFPVQCYENSPASITVSIDDKECFNQMVDKNKMPFWIVVPAAQFFDVSPGETLIKFDCSETFLPRICHGNDDQRELSFNISAVTVESYYPQKGFDLEVNASGGRWIRPEATFKVPVNKGSEVMFIEGFRNPDCIPESQLIQCFIQNKQIASNVVEHENFCIKVPIDSEFIQDELLEIRLYITPFFFPSACTDSPDENPHAIAIKNIVVI